MMATYAKNIFSILLRRDSQAMLMVNQKSFQRYLILSGKRSFSGSSRPNL